MRADFRREHQIAWAHAEAARLRESFGEAITVITHIIENAFTRGDRIITIEDPEGRGIPAAICVTEHSDEGSVWKAELFPVAGEDKDPVPPTKSIQHITLQMRYNMCVHATHDSVLGKASGDSGLPDFRDGVARLLNGEVVVHRKRSVGWGEKVPAYARIGMGSLGHAAVGGVSD
jgi:hypothetical protein